MVFCALLFNHMCVKLKQKYINTNLAEYFETRKLSVYKHSLQCEGLMDAKKNFNEHNILSLKVFIITYFYGITHMKMSYKVFYLITLSVYTRCSILWMNKISCFDSTNSIDLNQLI